MSGRFSRLAISIAAVDVPAPPEPITRIRRMYSFLHAPLATRHSSLLPEVRPLRREQEAPCGFAPLGRRGRTEDHGADAVRDASSGRRHATQGLLGGGRVVRRAQ